MEGQGHSSGMIGGSPRSRFYRRFARARSSIPSGGGVLSMLRLRVMGMGVVVGVVMGRIVGRPRHCQLRQYGRVSWIVRLWDIGGCGEVR